MKKHFTWKALVVGLSLAMSVGLVESCSDQSAAVPNLATKSVRSNMTQAEREEIITNHTAQLRAVERVIALGLLDPSVKPDFANVVTAATDSAANSFEAADWRATLLQINHRYAAAGHAMAAEMELSLRAHGGTDQDVELLRSSIWGVNLDGVLITTTVRLAYRDGMYPVAGTHAISTTQLHSPLADPVWVYNGTSYEATTKNLDELDGMKTWNVNLILADGQISNALYTQPTPSPETTQNLCIFCHCHRSETTGECISINLRRRCSCAANNIPRPTMSLL